MASRTANLTTQSPPFNPIITPAPGLSKPDKAGASPTPQFTQTGIPFFLSADLKERRLMFNFLDLAYEGGPAYRTGKDYRGMMILIEHENERADPLLSPTAVPTASQTVNKSEATLKNEKYPRRLRMVSYVNFVKPIIDKFWSYVLGVDPVRPEDKAITDAIKRIELDKNIDEMTADGLKFTEAWIGYDAANITLPDGKTTMSKAEIAAIDPKHKGEPYIVRIDPRCIADFDEAAGDITRVVIEEVQRTKGSIARPETKQVMYREWDAEGWRLYRLVINDKGEEFLVLVDQGSHTFGRCPFFRAIFPFPSKDIADLNRQHFNLGSVLDEELYQNTFSQRYVTGETAENITGCDKGAGNTMVLPNSNSKVGIIAGDPAQAQSLMARRQEIKDSIFELVSMAPMGKNVAESAEKKKRDLEALYTLLTKIAEVVETVENKLLIAMGIYAEEDDAQRTHYNRQFDVFTIDDLIAQNSDLAEASFIPPRLKRRLSLALSQKIDPFGPHKDYVADVDSMFDTSTAIVESLMGMKREGSLTPDMLVVALGIPKDLADDLCEAMNQHPDPNAPIDPLTGMPMDMAGDAGGGDNPSMSVDDTGAAPTPTKDKSNGNTAKSGKGGGGGNGGSGTKPQSDNATGTPTTDKGANGGRGKARGV